ncbi:hypothetical protein IEQ34_007182 [Dendrobium chrysotoxum]|uniref:ZZ-type domain-containing protein n=1 Tax=Dendrobium chrysotoxum TaxID=161865 RepID=A0AAV7H656_DENCH|nr:hypothetical protein IEQ34_007182 [Dendrobium chrysotoxum]
MASTSSLRPLGSKEQLVDVWNVVIKVNHGDNLRRFNAYMRQQFMIFEYDMKKLRAKISSLFKFSPDAVFELTYTDEDGDVVALDNDDELCDAVIYQRLNPLRINVQIKSYSTNGSYSGTSPVKNSDSNSDTGSDKAISACDRFSQLATGLNPTVESSRKSVPEPILRALANIFHEVIQTASTTPMFSELLSLLSKKQLTNVSQSSHESTGNPVGISGGTPDLVDSNTGDEPIVSNGRHNQLPTVLLPQTNFVSPIPENIQKSHEIGHSKQCLGCITYAPVILDQNISKEQKEVCDVCRDGKPMAAAKLPSLSTTTQVDYNFLGSFDKLNPNIASNVLHGNSRANMLPCDTTTGRPFDSVFSFKQQDGYTSHVDAIGNRTFASSTAFPCRSPMLHPYERSSSSLDSMPRPFHRGIICDGCGMHPIVGPRYMSTVFENYDLCTTCFRDMGNETEYMRIDWSDFQFPKAMKDQHKLQYGSQLPSTLASPNWMKAPIPKLDSCFIRDVTVWDGTVIGPCSRFTKIWKMRNNGTISWPFGTQLVRIPETGLPVDEELDIAVDFFSPSVPGQYMSYWQMLSPFGQKFGEEVWVIIQVDDHHQRASAFLSMSLPTKSSQQNNKVVMDVEPEPLDSNNLSVKMLKPVSSDMFNSTQQGSTSVLPAASQISNPYPLIDIPSFTNPPSDALAEEDMVEQTLLRELEEMGFKQIDLNKEILRQNQYDLEQSLEDLCGFIE